MKIRKKFVLLVEIIQGENILVVNALNVPWLRATKSVQSAERCMSLSRQDNEVVESVSPAEGQFGRLLPQVLQHLENESETYY